MPYSHVPRKLSWRQLGRKQHGRDQADERKGYHHDEGKSVILAFSCTGELDNEN
jgi:hypothetical protein